MGAHIRVIPEWFGGGALSRKDLHEAAEELTAGQAALIAVGGPTIGKGLDKALASMAKVVKRGVGATTGEITSELPEALKEADMVDMHLEVDIIPVSDVDRAKQFYQRLGWRLDQDAAPLEGLRIVQFTPPGLRGLGHLRHRAHHGRAGRGRGRADRLRHRRGPRRTGRPWHRCQRDLARPAVPGRGPAARPRPRPHQLRVVLLLHRSRRQYLAGPGGHHAAPWPGLRRQWWPVVWGGRPVSPRCRAPRLTTSTPSHHQ